MKSSLLLLMTGLTSIFVNLAYAVWKCEQHLTGRWKEHSASGFRCCQRWPLTFFPHPPCLRSRNVFFPSAKHTISAERASRKSETTELLECMKSWLRLREFTEADLHTIVGTSEEEAVEAPAPERPWMRRVCGSHRSFGAGGLVGLVHGLVWIYLDGREYERTVDCINSFGLN